MEWISDEINECLDCDIKSDVVKEICQRHWEQFLTDHEKYLRVKNTKEWISDKESLPPPGEMVLTFASYESDSHIYVEPVRFGFLDTYGNWINECTGIVEECKLTHWMPLPEPPTE